MRDESYGASILDARSRMNSKPGSPLVVNWSPRHPRSSQIKFEMLVLLAAIASLLLWLASKMNL